jgi:hypothetical protein
MVRALRKRDIGRSKRPGLTRFSLNTLPVLSAVAGPVAGLLAARKIPGYRAAALGGGIALAGGIPRLESDLRLAKKSREIMGARGDTLEAKRARHLGVAGAASLGSAVLGGVGAGMKPGRLAKATNAASWGLLLPALGTILYQSYKAKQKDLPNITP